MEALDDALSYIPGLWLQDETPAVRLENSTLAELTSSVPSRPEILVNNSTVRCLLDGHVDQYVEYLQGLQGSVESPADPETTDAKANENTGWLLPLIIITAGSCLRFLVCTP